MFPNLPIFHSKQSMIILQLILLIVITYYWGENKKKNCWNNSSIKSTVYLLIFYQKSMIFKGSPNHWRSLISPENEDWGLG